MNNKRKMKKKRTKKSGQRGGKRRSVNRGPVSVTSRTEGRNQTIHARFAFPCAKIYEKLRLLMFLTL
jgi:hypothetical protein